MLHWCLHQGDCILQEIAQTSSPWAMVETHLTEQMGWSWSSLNRSCECLVVVVVVVVVVVCRLPTIRELVAHQGRQVPQVGSLHHVHVVVGESLVAETPCFANRRQAHVTLSRHKKESGRILWIGTGTTRRNPSCLHSVSRHDRVEAEFVGDTEGHTGHVGFPCGCVMTMGRA